MYVLIGCSLYPPSHRVFYSNQSLLLYAVYLQARYFENPQVIAENTVPSPEMVGMITSVLVKTAPEREDSETRTVRGQRSLPARFSALAAVH